MPSIIDLFTQLTQMGTGTPLQPPPPTPPPQQEAPPNRLLQLLEMGLGTLPGTRTPQNMPLTLGQVKDLLEIGYLSPQTRNVLEQTRQRQYEQAQPRYQAGPWGGLFQETSEGLKELLPGKKQYMEREQARLDATQELQEAKWRFEKEQAPAEQQLKRGYLDVQRGHLAASERGHDLQVSQLDFLKQQYADKKAIDEKEVVSWRSEEHIIDPDTGMATGEKITRVFFHPVNKPQSTESFIVPTGPAEAGGAAKTGDPALDAIIKAIREEQAAATKEPPKGEQAEAHFASASPIWEQRFDLGGDLGPDWEGILKSRIERDVAEGMDVQEATRRNIQTVEMERRAKEGAAGQEPLDFGWEFAGSPAEQWKGHLASAAGGLITRPLRAIGGAAHQAVTTLGAGVLGLGRLAQALYDRSQGQAQPGALADAIKAFRQEAKVPGGVSEAEFSAIAILGLLRNMGYTANELLNAGWHPDSVRRVFVGDDSLAKDVLNTIENAITLPMRAPQMLRMAGQTAGIPGKAVAPSPAEFGLAYGAR